AARQLRTVRSQRVADDLLVVARIEMLVRVRGMHPVDVRELAAVFGGCRRLDHLRAADLLVPFRAQLRDHQLAAVVVDEIAVAMTDDETGDPPSPLPGDLLCLPHPLAGLGPDATELTVAADAVDVVAVDHRRGDHGVQAVGLNLALALALPEHGG